MARLLVTGGADAFHDKLERWRNHYQQVRLSAQRALNLCVCVMLMDGLLGKLAFTGGASILVGSQCAILGWLGVLGTAYFYVSESPVATWVLNHHPSWCALIP
ncbi:MAG: hypothetical protein ACRESX_12880 [Gammaproteobacteria bacterium]